MKSCFAVVVLSVLAQLSFAPSQALAEGDTGFSVKYEFADGWKYELTPSRFGTQAPDETKMMWHYWPSHTRHDSDTGFGWRVDYEWRVQAYQDPEHPECLQVVRGGGAVYATSLKTYQGSGFFTRFCPDYVETMRYTSRQTRSGHLSHVSPSPHSRWDVGSIRSKSSLNSILEYYSEGP